jgi:hypothetical protein
LPHPGAAGIMPGMNDHPAPAILRLADGAVLVIEVDDAGQIVHTRIDPDGTTTVEVVPGLQ